MLRNDSKIVLEDYSFFNIKTHMRVRVQEILKEGEIPLHPICMSKYIDAYYYAGAKSVFDMWFQTVFED